MIRPWSHIMVHHSLTRDTGTVSWRAIRDYHVKTLGWLDIGYHFGIELISHPLDALADAKKAAQGGCTEIPPTASYEVLKGRWLSIRGAHCKQGGMNGKAIGICLVGNYDLIEPSIAALNVTALLIMELQEIFNIPKEGLVFHRFYADKSCPGKLFKFDMLQDLII